MLRIATIACFVAWLSGLATPAAAQVEPSSNCTDDRGVDRCSAEQHRRVLALFGLKPIEDHARAGDQIRRAFYVDGYGRDIVAINFIRPPGADPRLEVHYPNRDGAPRRPANQAQVPAAAWQEVLARSAHFDRDLVPNPPPAASVRGHRRAITICLHSWVYVVEAADPARPGEDGPSVRREVQDACGEGLAIDYATQVQGLAVSLLPHCAALDASQHRNGAMVLSACGMLEGDRVAAAGAVNALEELRRVRAGAGSALAFFQEDARLDWAGQPIGAGSMAAGNAWLQRVSSDSRTHFQIVRAAGEAADRVRVDGRLVRYVSAADVNQPATAAEAEVTLWFVASNGFGARVQRGTVGQFRTIGN